MRIRLVVGSLVAASLVLFLVFLLAPTAPSVSNVGAQAQPAPAAVRFASFNASLNRNSAGQLITDLSDGTNVQAQKVAEIIQRTAPDVLLINEFDYDPNGDAARLFQQNYLGVSQNGTPPINYPHVYLAPSNTGIPSGLDFDNSGSVGGPGDAFGFGFFPGQFGMVLFSKYPIMTDTVRTFQQFRWKDMPGALLPDDPNTPEPGDYYSAEELEIFRLSSKSHWDIPINVNGKMIHVLASHPTPPVFDSPTIDWNGRRNHDEIRFWADYILPGKGDYIYSDNEIVNTGDVYANPGGGLAPGASFVIMGDQNADPFDGDSTNNAALLLVDSPMANTSRVPYSAGGTQQALIQGAFNENHTGPSFYDTADFGDGPPNGPGNLRVDYVLPSKDLGIRDARVFWPLVGQPGADLVDASDHRLVWVDVLVENTLPNAVASGDVTQDSAVLWARSTATGPISFTYARNPLDNLYAEQPGTTLVANVTDPMLPVKVQLSDLQANTHYSYQVQDSAGTTFNGEFKTPAAVGMRTGLRFGVVGDWQEPPPYPSLVNVDEKMLDFFVQHSDNIYADISTPAVPISQARTLEDFRMKYVEVHSTTLGFNAMMDLRPSVSVLATIDDHEITDNFAGGAPPAQGSNNPNTVGVFSGFANDFDFTNDTPPYENGMQAFQEYNPLRDEFYPDSGNFPSVDGERKLYRYQTYGSDAAVFITDPRSFRDAQITATTSLTEEMAIGEFLGRAFQPGRTLLGTPQLLQLKQDLLDAKARGITWKFVFISEPVQNLGVLNAEDRYEGYAAERTELLRFIDENKIENVVFVAADVHGTLVNNMDYQMGPGQPNMPTGAFEVVVGPVAFFSGVFGNATVGLALAAGLITQDEFNQFFTLDMAGRDQFIKNLVDGQVVPQGYSPLGLEGSDIDAALIKGDYIAANKYGWTEFEIDQATQALTVSTYGMLPYDYTDFVANPSNVLPLTPELVSQFVVTATAVTTDAVRIRDIQGAGHVSPFNGVQVPNVSGIVTALRSNGFYMQDSQPDDNVATSEGIFVFTDAAPTVSVGDAVRVTGLVNENRPGSTGLSITRIENPTVETVSSGNELPAPIIIGNGGRVPPSQVIDDDAGANVELAGTFDPTGDGIDFYESLEGMRVQVNDAVAVSGTSRFGEIAVVSDNGANASVRTANGGLVIQPTDFNPERILIDDSIISDEPAVNTGHRFNDPPIVGVMDYTFGNFKLFNTAALPAGTPSTVQPEVTMPVTDALKVATFNVLNLDPGDSDDKFNALATQIITNMNMPDIIGLQEIQDNTGSTDDGVVAADQTYQKLIAAITAQGGPAYQFREIAPVDNQDGGAPGSNIRVGFLFNPMRVAFVDRGNADATTATMPMSITTGSGVQLSLSPGRIDPTNPAFAEDAQTGFDGTRKSLAGEFIYKGQTIIVIVNHFKSKSGDEPLFGPAQPPTLTTEPQRVAQAQVVNDFVDSILAIDPAANVIVLGDMNDFEFSAPLDALKGGVLKNLVEDVPQNERYTFIFDGNSQVLDHILVSNNLSATATVDIVHTNVDFADRSRASDHEPIVATFRLPFATFRRSVGSSLKLPNDPLSNFGPSTTISVPTNVLTGAVFVDFQEIDPLELPNRDGVLGLTGVDALLGAYALILRNANGDALPSNNLAAPIEVIIEYKDVPDGSNEAGINLYRNADGTATWNQEGIVVTSRMTETNTLNLTISSLSNFGLTIGQVEQTTPPTIYLPIILR